MVSFDMKMLAPFIVRMTSMAVQRHGDELHGHAACISILDEVFFRSRLDRVPV
jgi:hypothetical protein